MTGPSRDRASSDVGLRAALFAFGGGSILLGVSPTGSWLMVATGFAVVFFLLRRHLWEALCGRREE